MGDIGFANEMAIRGLGATAGSVMTDCEKYGMCYGICRRHNRCSDTLAHNVARRAMR